MNTSNVVVKWDKLNQWAARELEGAVLSSVDDVSLTGRKIESVFKHGEDLIQIAWASGSCFVPGYYVTDLDELAQKLVRDELGICQSSLVEELLKREVFAIDDIENFYGRKDEDELKDEYSDEWHIWSMAGNMPDSFVDYLIKTEQYVHVGEPDDDESLATEFSDQLETWEKITDLNENNPYDSFTDYLLEGYFARREDITEDREIFEWWTVSGFLERDLRDAGQPILDNDYGTWWGRCTTGQQVYADGVIQDIARRVARA